MDAAPAQRPLGTLERPSWRLRLGLGGIAFMVALALAFRLRALLLGLDSPLTLNEQTPGWLARLLGVGLLLTPLLHIGAHRLAAALVDISLRLGYGRMLLAPLGLDLLALPLLAVPAISPDATVVIAVNTALLAGDLLVYFWLRRFAAAARVVTTDEEIMVYGR